ncbi:MAG: hypothetical protein RL581_889 [Actinomycetota bacterium]
MKIKAAVLDEVGKDFRIAEVDIDKPKSGEILVKVAASGLCASDLNAIDGKRKLVWRSCCHVYRAKLRTL